MATFRVALPQPDTTVITFGSDAIGGPEAVELSTIVREAAAAGARAVVFNLEHVTVMNSSGLGMLVSALTTLKKSNTSLRLAGVPEKVMDLLVMTHLRSVFELHATVDEAVANE